MRIVIATGIYPPDIGGPALYAEGVAKVLEQEGHVVSLSLFSAWKKYPSGIRHLLYTISLMRSAIGTDAIFAFDTWSVGVPAAFVGMILGKPVVVRVGGDFVWEQYLERTRDLVPLPKFYTQPRALSAMERFEIMCVRFLTRHAHLAFNTSWLRDIWAKPYRLDLNRTSILENVIGERLGPSKPVDLSILFFSRQIVFKNIPAFQRAYQRVQKEIPKLTLQTGSIAHDALMERINECYAVAIPSVSEVAPNTLIDALRYGKPCILSKYSGYAERFKDMCVLVDPLSEEDMMRGIREICNPSRYAELRAAIHAYTEVRTYDDVAREFLAIINPV